MSDARDLPVSFPSFVVSLAASAMVHLGETADPAGKKEINLPLARNTIDVLRILQEKTKGNLDDEEQQLLDSLVEDLGAKLDAAS